MLAFAITSCGGEEGGREAAAIPRDVAEQLAAQSLDVAEALESGDACGAAELADSMRASARRAIQRGQVPAPLASELERAVARLTRQIECVTSPNEEEPEPGDAPPGEDDDGDGGDATTSTTADTTTTEPTTTVEDTTTTLEETTTLDEG